MASKVQVGGSQKWEEAYEGMALLLVHWIDKEWKMAFAAGSFVWDLSKVAY